MHSSGDHKLNGSETNATKDAKKFELITHDCMKVLLSRFFGSVTQKKCSCYFSLEHMLKYINEVKTKIPGQNFVINKCLQAWPHLMHSNHRFTAGLP